MCQQLKKILSALLLAAVGFLIGGLFGWIGTIYVYGIGAMLTGPLGCGIGGYIGWKTPLRNASLMFQGCVGSMMIASAILKSSEMDGLLRAILIMLIGCIGSTLINAPGINRIQFQKRRPLSLVLSSALLLWIIIKIYIALYVIVP